MADKLAQMKRYIKGTIREEIPERYQISVPEIVALVQMSKCKDIVDTFIFAFEYGFSKGARFARKENKKRA